MSNYKFTSSVKSAFISELKSGLEQFCPSDRHYLRAVCLKVGISHSTFYRHMRSYRRLVSRGEPFTETESELLAFGRQVDALVCQLRQNRREGDLRSLKKCVDRLFADGESEVHKMRQLENTKMRKHEKRIASLEQQTDQLTQGVGYFKFSLEKSQKNM